MSDDSTTTPMEIAGKIDSNDATATDIESQILATMRSRATYLREKSDSLTLESVRRLLEEDMKLEKHALDVHKSFVKQHLVECLEGVENDGTSENNSQETEKKDDVTPVKEAAKLSKERKSGKDVKEDTTGDDAKTEGSPVMGIMTEENTSKSVAEDSKEVLQSEIKKALRKRSSYIKANSEKITMGILRRLLEQDLKLEKYSLDPYKKFISEELEQVLQASDATKPSSEAKKKNLTKKVNSTSAKKLDSEDEISESDGEDEEEEDKEVAVKKKTAQKRVLSKSEGTGKRKREKEKVASAKKTKQRDSRSDSDEGNSVSSSVKKQQPATPVYGKRVEKLKAVIKSCGMSVPPSVYKKVKQAPEKKREDALIKELEEILTKEGLSSSPSEKEIKEVKKRKQITKELEGIDTSNIVSSSRRRSSASFVPPPKPKIVEESESDESEDSENEDDDEVVEEEGEEDEVEDEEEDEVESNEDGGEGSQTKKEPNTEDGAEEESK